MNLDQDQRDQETHLARLWAKLCFLICPAYALVCVQCLQTKARFWL